MAIAPLESVDPPSVTTTSQINPASNPSINDKKVAGRLLAELSVGMTTEIGADMRPLALRSKQLIWEA
jgi:hypothetical protein